MLLATVVVAHQKETSVKLSVILELSLAVPAKKKMTGAYCWQTMWGSEKKIASEQFPVLVHREINYIFSCKIEIQGDIKSVSIYFR